MTTHDAPPKLDALHKVVTLVGLMNGFVPPWAEGRDHLQKLVCALTDMDVSEAEEAIQEAAHHGLIKYYGPQD